MESVIRLVDFKLVADYAEDQMRCNSDGMLLEVDSFGVYDVEDNVYDKDIITSENIIGKIASIFVHHESGSAWLLVRTESGTLIEIDIDYDDCISDNVPY